MKLTRVIETKNAFAYEYTFKNSKRFYTIEFHDSPYMDFYEDEASWKEALKNGSNTDKRVESMPNVFLDDEYENTFFGLCAIFAACGDLKQTFEAFVSVFEFKEHTTLKPCKLG